MLDDAATALYGVQRGTEAPAVLAEGLTGELTCMPAPARARRVSYNRQVAVVSTGVSSLVPAVGRETCVDPSQVHEQSSQGVARRQGTPPFFEPKVTPLSDSPKPLIPLGAASAA